MSFIRCIALALLFATAAIAPIPSHAQEWNEAASLYSQGVHAYFAGRSTDAESYLSRALAVETQDPRLYYFRALSLMRLGRTDEARGDMMVGANLEAQHPGRFAVGTALQRVQGTNRLTLERYRREGRAEAATRRERVRQQRYPQTFDQESQVLRRRIVIPLDDLMRPGGPRPLSAQELAAQRPVAPQNGRHSAARPAAQPARDDPFQDDPQLEAGPPAATEAPAADAAATPPQTTESTPDDSAAEEEEKEAPASDTPAEPEAEADAEEDDEDPFSGV